MAATTPRKGKPTPKQKPSLDSMLDSARLAERSVELCLRGDLQADFEDVERQLREARTEQNDTRLTSGAEAKALAEELELLREQMTDSMITIRLRALPKLKWTKLLVEHKSDDPKQAFNADTFVPALLKLSVVDPEFTDGQWVKLIGDAESDGALSSAQYDLLSDAAWNLNRKDATVPFSRLGSALLRNSEPTSKQPIPSG